MTTDKTTQASTIEQRFETIYKQTPDMKGWFEVKVAAVRAEEVLDLLEIPENVQINLQWEFMNGSNMSNHLLRTGLLTTFQYRGIDFTLCTCASYNDENDHPIGSTITLKAKELNSQVAYRYAKFSEYRAEKGNKTRIATDIYLDDNAAGFRGTVRYSCETGADPIMKLLNGNYNHNGHTVKQIDKIPTQVGQAFMKRLHEEGEHPTGIIKSMYIPEDVADTQPV